MQAATNTHSTQVLTQKIKLENEISSHISIKDRISRNFRKEKVHAISVYYDNSTNSKQSRFVKHEGKENVIIIADDIFGENQHEKTLEGNWPEAINRLVTETDKRVEKIDLTQLLECDFSTTTSSSLTASRIVLLDMVKAYFNLRAVCACGIPKVTLEGTLEDWTKLQEKVIKLRNLNLELDFWLNRLEPVIWKLIDTYRGEIDEEFWSKIMSLRSYGSGGEATITGWIAAFFPYDRTKNALHSNSLDRADIPDGVVEVPFTADIGSSFL
ncbi:hypothetical protein F8M41_000875 [Gigaspora margarita]|uniref:Uncharacterized protein n=1 Tax=Gigaspora margarita TaxID=4874 RepID=A0A8H4AZD6_GIGMA|nr:hypothetical protein F8M41_000875 [Gigaspora margarita]